MSNVVEANQAGVRAGTPTKRLSVLCVGRSLAGGGAERVQIELLRALEPNFDLEVFYMNGQGPLQALLPRSLAVRLGRISPDSDVLSRIRTVLSLLWAARRHDVILGMQDTSPIYLAVLAGRLWRKPVVGWIHCIWSWTKPELSRAHAWLAPLLYPLARQFAAVSQGAANDMAREVPRLAGKLSVIYNQLREDELRLQAAEPLAPAHRALFRDRVILAAGRLEHVKGFDVLIEAFARTSFEAPTRLLIVGEGTCRAELEAQIRELGVQDRVHLLGFTINPYPYIAQADVFVLSSRHEGLAIVLQEALALGTPIVATNCPGGPSELLGGGEYGLLVPVDDPDALSRALAEVLTDREGAARRARAGQQSVARFDPEHISRQFTELLTRAADRRTSS